MPSRKYEAEGKTKYYEFNTFEDRALGDKFKAEIMKVLQEHMKNHSEPSDPKPF